MRRTFTLQLEPTLWRYWSEASRALAVPCFVCEVPAGEQCLDNPEDPEIVYQWPPLADRDVRFHEGRVNEDDPR